MSVLNFGVWKKYKFVMWVFPDTYYSTHYWLLKALGLLVEGERLLLLCIKSFREALVTLCDYVTN